MPVIPREALRLGALEVYPGGGRPPKQPQPWVQSPEDIESKFGVIGPQVGLVVEALQHDRIKLQTPSQAAVDQEALDKG
jgi:hypothetical protein